MDVTRKPIIVELLIQFMQRCQNSASKNDEKVAFFYQVCSEDFNYYLILDLPLLTVLRILFSDFGMIY